MARRISPQFMWITGLIAASAWVSGCKSCSQTEPTPDAPVAAAKPVQAPPAQAAKPKAVARDDLSISGNAVAVLIGDKVHLWVDGRTSSIQMAPDKVSWTPQGFEYAATNGVRVLAPGGGIYWKATPSTDAKPLQPMFDTPSTPPQGYKLNANMSRGTKYRVGLSGPDGRRARLGISDEPPKASVWLVATLPSGGKVSPELGSDAGWKTDESGAPLQQIPDGATAVPTAEPSAQDLADWKTDLEKLRGAGVKWTLKTTVDVDADGKLDGVLCVTGGEDDYSCYVAHKPGAEWHYHGIHISWSGDDAAAAPLVFQKGDGVYVMGVDSVGRGQVVHVARFNGSAFVTDTVK